MPNNPKTTSLPHQERITEILQDKDSYMELLLIADEQEDMVMRYLNRGRLFALYDGELRTICVVTEEGDGILEIKNLATLPHCRKRGYARCMLEALSEQFKEEIHTMIVGTGDSPLTIPFYERCGFKQWRIIPDFFTTHYRHPIIEDGVLLRDMIYLKKELSTSRKSMGSEMCRI